jgi:uncharacterized protein YjdB
MSVFRLTVAGVMLVSAASCKSATAPPTGGAILVVIDPATVNMKAGFQVQLKATVTGPPGITQGVTWRAINPDIATVSANGLVTAIIEGTALVRASWIPDPEEFSVATINVTSSPIMEEGRASQVRRPPR